VNIISEILVTIFPNRLSRLKQLFKLTYWNLSLNKKVFFKQQICMLFAPANSCNAKTDANSYISLLDCNLDVGRP
jgi:hypothetical protein